MRNLAALFIVLYACGACAAVDIEIRGTPELPVPNLIPNPGFEESEGENPAHWSFSTANPENFIVGLDEDGRRGKCVFVKAHEGIMSGYWVQRVAVEPGKKYLFGGHQRVASGRVLCYVHATHRLGDGAVVEVNQRHYSGIMREHWLIPVFLNPSDLAVPDPAQWFPWELAVTVPPPLETVSLSIGLYFSGGQVWFDDLWAQLAETDLQVEVSTDDEAGLARVVVQRVGEQALVLDSGELEAGTQHYAIVLAGQQTDAVYEVTAIKPDGTAIHRRYPAGEEN